MGIGTFLGMKGTYPNNGTPLGPVNLKTQLVKTFRDAENPTCLERRLSLLSYLVGN